MGKEFTNVFGAIVAARMMAAEIPAQPRMDFDPFEVGGKIRCPVVLSKEPTTVIKFNAQAEVAVNAAA
ncbi:hypothetical protein HY025_03225 [Candidatus Daviesbacteria bacterium]|nr:hypothetical protein [Candidatus Daviesbacteria bacterium]